ncbi:hypothetical protein F0L68_41435, partial [Solihabitans fulvus]
MAGAEGGLGTSLVTALVGETVAAASPGPTVLVDQGGSPWGALTRRLLGQRGGLPANYAQSLLHQGIPAPQVLGSAPTSSAGAAVVADTAGYTPLREVFRLAQTLCGGLVVDAGRVDAHLTAQLDDLHPVVVLVGRAGLVGAG